MRLSKSSRVDEGDELPIALFRAGRRTTTSSGAKRSWVNVQQWLCARLGTRSSKLSPPQGFDHHCLDAPLARLEGGIVPETLNERFPSMLLLDDRPVFHNRIVLRGFKSRPVACTGA